MTSIAPREVRETALEALLDMELPDTHVASIVGVSPRTLRRWVARYKQCGEVAPRARGHRKSLFTPADRRKARDLLARDPDMTLAELHRQLGVDASLASVCRLRQQVQQGRKKRNAP